MSTVYRAADDVAFHCTLRPTDRAGIYRVVGATAADCTADQVRWAVIQSYESLGFGLDDIAVVVRANARGTFYVRCTGLTKEARRFLSIGQLEVVRTEERASALASAQ